MNWTRFTIALSLFMIAYPVIIVIQELFHGTLLLSLPLLLMLIAGLLGLRVAKYLK